MTISVSNVSQLERKLDKVWRAIPEYRNRNELVVDLLEEAITNLMKQRKIKL